MNLHVVAYPELAPADLERIQQCRRDHNTLYGIIGAHFTIVFSVPDMPLADFAAEVRQQLAGTGAIQFCLRCAAINKDVIGGNYDAFLVPDEGFSAISRLHDKLYSGKLSAHHRLDIPYIPHLSIASSPGAHTIKKIVDEWNKHDFAISGVISALDIINYENRVITTVDKIKLSVV